MPDERRMACSWRSLCPGAHGHAELFQAVLRTLSWDGPPPWPPSGPPSTSTTHRETTPLAVLLVLLGLIGLALGRLGETTWAPATETTASVELSDPGPAVVIDPGVLYVGGMEGEVTIEGESDSSSSPRTTPTSRPTWRSTTYTRITGASDLEHPQHRGHASPREDGDRPLHGLRSVAHREHERLAVHP